MHSTQLREMTCVPPKNELTLISLTSVSRRLVQAGSPALAPSPPHPLPGNAATWNVVAWVRDKISLFCY